MSYQDKLNEAEKSEHNSSGSGWFKFKEGKNSIRILTEPEPLFEDFKKGICYTGCGYTGSAKTLAYVLDNGDGKVKLMKIPYTISKLIAEYEISEDWSFNGFPMPYDIVIGVKNAGTKEVEYTPTPRPVRSEVTSDTIEQMSKNKKTCLEVIEIMKAKNIEKHKADGSWQKEQERQANLKKELGDARSVKAGPLVIDNGGVEYPTEEINPEDIPF